MDQRVMRPNKPNYLLTPKSGHTVKWNRDLPQNYDALIRCLAILTVGRTL